MNKESTVSLQNREYRTAKLFFRHTVSAPWKGEEREMHAHNLFELIYFVRGDASHIIEDRKYPLTRGDLVIVRPKKHHDIVFSSNKEYERYNILFDLEALGLWRAAEVSERFEVVSLADEPAIASVFSRMARYHEELPEEEFGEAAVHLLFTLFYDLSLLATDGRAYAPLHPTLSRALAYIRDNLFTVRSVAEIAEALKVTESYLFRLFRTELGTGPKRYLTEKRLVAAQSFIRLGRRPSEVYLDCGFSDYTAFWRAYKKMFGTSPSDE